MRKNILIVEDEKDIIEVLRYYLEKENYRIHVAQDGFNALELASKIIPNLILLDLMLPRLDGIETCRRLKADEHLRDIPIIMVTAKAEEADKVKGLEIGADDYVTKPFSAKELVARVKAHLRRCEGSIPEKSFQYGSLSVDTVKHEIRFRGGEIDLTAKEFELLLYMLENKGRVLTRDMILNHVWGYDYFGSTRTVDVHVTRLRQKIPLLTNAISTIKSFGYKLKEQAPD
ncbi:response regulator transcription factor [bacterium]|nr:response regulator transcription factor [bacterium]MCI0612650.1 response regulator transcription factor [bacterium]